MNVSIAKSSDQIVLKPDSNLDAVSSAELEKAILEITSAGTIILDLSDVEYISSAGVRQLLLAHRQAQQLSASFSVVKVNPQVMSILKITGIDSQLDISQK